MDTPIGLEGHHFADVKIIFIYICDEIFYCILFSVSSAIYCPRLTVPKYGSVNYSSLPRYGSFKGYHKAGSVSEYSCKYGYKLVGISSRTCLISGRWGGKAPICKRNILILFDILL